MDREQKRTTVGAAFLLAASSVGPSFLTQLPRFTAQIGLSFFYAILIVVLADLVAKVNIWSIIGASGLTGPQIADRVKKGLGAALSVVVAFGGLAFNVGNIGGVLGITIFCMRGAKRVVDRLSVVLSGVIVVSLIVITVKAQPPVLAAIASVPKFSAMPGMFFPLITLLGASCGGYVPFSGAHRLLESRSDSPYVFRRAAILGASVSEVIRLLLFFSVIGVCYAGRTLIAENAASIIGSNNPAAQTFLLAAGEWGKRLFGVTLFAAGLACTIGAAYTSVSFLKTLHPAIERHERACILGMIVSSALILLIFGNVAQFVVLSGTVNGFVLPISLGCILLVAHRRDIVGDYRHPVALTAAGWLIVLLSAVLAVRMVVQLFVS